MILSRLKRAITEQNWFAVVLEVFIVVIGVVIGFQVTAWGDRRSDAAREQTYLQQLAADLGKTEQRVADTEAFLIPTHRAASEFVRAFRSSERPSRDSLIQWRRESGRLRVVLPVTGTVEALIATGDLALIRDDSLRAAITSYAQVTATTTVAQQQWAERQRTARDELNGPMDYNEVLVESYSAAELDSLIQAEPMRGIQVGTRRAPFPFTVESVLTDPVAYQAANKVNVAKMNMMDYRREMLDATRELRVLVESQIKQ